MVIHTVGLQVRVVGKYSGLARLGTVTKVSPTGKVIYIKVAHLAGALLFNYVPTMDVHFSDYAGYVFASGRM